jgi:N-acetylglucosamine-6-phosphate deacetylase
LVLADAVVRGSVTIDDGWITAVELDDEPAAGEPAAGPGAGRASTGARRGSGRGLGSARDPGPLIAPGYADIHVHGWGGHDATGGAEALTGMARALLRRGVTSFLPTAPSLVPGELGVFVERVRRWLPVAPSDGAEPLGFNLEGPFLAPARAGAHDPRALRTPRQLGDTVAQRWSEGLRVITIAPELRGATGLIRRLVAGGVVVSLGHSSATLDEARAGYAAGARSTTHLFNAMSGLDHRSPGLATAALAEDGAWVELIADGLHVHPALWHLVARAKPRDRLVLVSDAIAVAGTGDGRTSLGGLEVEVRDGRATLAGTSTLAGSVIGLDSAVRNVVREGLPLPDAVAAASANPLALIGQGDRGRIEPGWRAHLVELGPNLEVRRVTRGFGWIDGAG